MSKVFNIHIIHKYIQRVGTPARDACKGARMRSSVILTMIPAAPFVKRFTHSCKLTYAHTEDPQKPPAPKTLCRLGDVQGLERHLAKALRQPLLTRPLAGVHTLLLSTSARDVGLCRLHRVCMCVRVCVCIQVCVYMSVCMYV
jgi:hypothetical protein